MKQLGRIVEMLLPPIAYFRVRRLLKRQIEPPDDRAWWRRNLGNDAQALAMADEIYETEAERLTGLEAKLRSTLNYVTPFVPLAAAALVSAIARRSGLAFAFSALASLELLGAYVVALTGTEARRVSMVTNEVLAEVLMSRQRERAWRAEKLHAAMQNRWIGIDLNNAISVVGAAIARTVVSLSVAGAILLFGVGSTGEAHEQKPSGHEQEAPAPVPSAGHGRCLAARNIG